MAPRKPPPNSSQQPTRGRSLARRFRASCFVGSVSVWSAPEGTRSAELKNVGPTALSILCLVRNCVELLPAAPLPPARCKHSVDRSSLSAACTCEGAHVSHRRRWPPCAPRSRVLRVL